MMKITGLSHLFKWENLHNWWLTKYFFCPTVNTFTFMHLADAFIQSDLVMLYIFLSVHVYPGNRTHNLCAANAMLFLVSLTAQTEVSLLNQRFPWVLQLKEG